MRTSSSPTLRSPFLRDYQAAVFRQLFRGVTASRGQTFTVLFPRQAGKNEVSAALVSALLLAHAGSGGSIVLCAPTYRPQGRISEERTWHALDRVMRALGAGIARREENRIVAGNAQVIFLSASPAAHSPGHTASIALIADEAQDIDEEWFDRQFRPMAASTGASTVLFGTPWNGRTLLDHAVARNRRLDAANLGLGASNRRLDTSPGGLDASPDALAASPGGDSRLRLHHEVPWERVAESRPVYGDYVRQERNRLGADHPLFLSQYGLRTVESAGRMFSNAQLAAIEGQFSRLAEPIAGERYVAGLDVGGDGQRADATVLTIARLLPNRVAEVVQQHAWSGAAYRAVEGEVLELARRWRLERVVVDGTGLGGPVAAALHEALGELVERLHFTGAVKSALGYALISAIDTGRLRIFADDGSAEARTLRRELAACESRYGTGRELRWGDDSGHDDHVVSLSLALRAAETAGPARVAVGRKRKTEVRVLSAEC